MCYSNYRLQGLVQVTQISDISFLSSTFTYRVPKNCISVFCITFFFVRIAIY